MSERNDIFPLYKSIGPEEEEAALRVLRSGCLSGFLSGSPEARDAEVNGGSEVRTLEDAWKQTYGVRHAITFNSATSALLAASGAIGLKTGDRAICPPWTMSATVAAPMFYGAKVDFADIEDETWCIDPDKIEPLIRAETKAIFAVNLFGHPANLTPLREIARHHRLRLIEDSAQTPRARYYGRWAGTLSDIGIYSLNRHKHIHCGEGGVAVTDDDEIARRMRSIRNHGVSPLGLNLRMTEIEAAIATVQLHTIAKHIQCRRKLAEALSDGLKDCMDVPVVRKNCEHNYYLWTGRFHGEHGQLKVPHISGYIQPLHRVFDSRSPCPVVDRERELVVCFEICKYDIPDPTPVIEAFRAAAECRS